MSEIPGDYIQGLAMCYLVLFGVWAGTSYIKARWF